MPLVPKVHTLTIANATTYSTTANKLDVLGTYGSDNYAKYISIRNDCPNDVHVRFNQDSACTFTVDNGTTVTFNSDSKLYVSHVAIDNSASGAASGTVEIFLMY